jgi:hypothetical protein
MVKLQHKLFSAIVLLSLIFHALCLSAGTPVNGRTSLPPVCEVVTNILVAAPKPSSFQLGDDISTMITYRDLDKSPVLQKAADIFRTKLTDSSPLQEAALELLKTCKSAEDLSTPSNSVQNIKESAKATYAIKYALLNQAAAGVESPAACRSFGPGSRQFTLFDAVKGRRRHDSVPTTSERTACMKDLWKKGNSWTSYSNGMQDANTLCEVPDLENAQRAILDLLSDMNFIIPEWINTMNELQNAHLEFLRQQKAHVAEMNEMQRRQREEFEDNNEAAKAAMACFMDDTKSHLEDMTNGLRGQLLSADMSVEQMRQVGNPKATRDLANTQIRLLMHTYSTSS